MPEIANIIWADGPSTLPSQPPKSKVRSWGTWVESNIAAFFASGGKIYQTRTLLNADLTPAANSIAWVMEDATVANNGIYRKVGGTGTGSWVRAGDLPFSFIVASNPGLGTANAIVATTSVPVSSSALVILPIAVTNTASPITVAFNGGSALTIKTVSGNNPVVGGLVGGMMAVGVVSGSTFRLLSDQASSAILDLAEAAADRADTAADTSVASAAAALAAANAGFVFNKESDFTSAAIPSILVSVVISGYSAPGDLGAHEKIRISTPGVIRPWHKQSADGAWWEISSKIVTPEMFGAAGNGATDDSTALENFFIAVSLLNVSGKIDNTYRITRNISAITLASGGVSVSGRGAIYVDSSAATKPIQIIVPHETALAVTDISSVSYTFPDASGASIATRVTAAGHTFLAGDLVKIVADDVIGGGTDANRRIGEFFFVGDVSGSFIYLAGSLTETYATNRRICRVRQDVKVVWDGPSIYMNWAQAKANNWVCEALTIRGAFRPYLRAKFRQITNACVNISSCVQADVKIAVSQLLNRVSTQGIPGYGVMDTCSWQSRIHVDGEDGRHFYTSITNTAATDDETYKYGRTKDCVVTGSSFASSSAAYDTHAEAIGCVFSGAVAADSRFGEASPGAGFQLRGRYNKILNCSARGGQVGAQVQALTSGDGIGNQIINFTYDGSGDGIRVDSSSALVRSKGTRIIGGVLGGTGDRLVRMEDCDDVFIDQLTLAPSRQTDGAVGILMRGNATLRIGTLYVDTSGMSSAALANWRAISFDTGVTGNSVTVERMIHVAGDAFQAWFNGNSTSGTCRIFEVTGSVAPTGGTAINVGSMTTLFVPQRGQANHGVGAVADEVQVNSNSFALDVATRSDEEIVIIADPTVSNARINSITSGNALGQRLTILRKNGSTNVLQVSNNPSGGVVSGSTTNINPGVSFVWSGYHWHKDSFTIGPYVSSQQSYSNAGAVSVTHGLGARPTKAWLDLVCLTADNGFAAGNTVTLYPSGSNGVTAYASSTTVDLRIGALGIQIGNKGTGVITALTPASWAIVVRAEL